MSSRPARRRALVVLITVTLAAFGLIQASPALAAPASGPAHPVATAPAPVSRTTPSGSAEPDAAPAAVTPITPGVPFAFTTPADGTSLSFSFSGTSGRRVVLTTSGAPFSTFWTPVTSGTGLTSANVFNGYGELGVLGATGAVTLSVRGSYPDAETYTATLTLVQDVTGSLPFGPAVSPAFTAAGTNAEYTFPATEGQRLALNVSTVKLTSSDAQPGVTFTLTRPDGTLATGLTNDPLYGTQPIYAATLLTADLDATGTWTLTVDPQTDSTGSVTFTAGRPVDTVIATTSGKSLALTYKGDGSDVRLTFTAAVGQRVTLGVTASDLQDPLNDENPAAVRATLLRPDGTVGGTLSDLSGTTFTEQQDADTFAPNLVDVAGTWTLLLHPEGSTKGTQTARLGLVTDRTATLKLGRATAVKIAAAGQNAAYTVTGTPGEHLIVTLDSTGLTSGASGGDPDSASADVYQLDSAGNRYDIVNPEQDGYGTTDLPADGTATIVVDPVSDSVGTVTLTVGPPKVAKAALVLGRSTTVTIGRGDEADYTVKGTVGRRIGIDLTATTYATSSEGYGPGYGLLGVSVLRPDGTEFSLSGTDGGLVTTPVFLETPPLDAAGTWTIVLKPYNGASGTFTFAGYEPTDVTGTLSAGAAHTLKIGTPAQQARYTFHGVSGRRITLDTSASAWSSATNPEAKYPKASLYRPDGSYFGDLDYFYPYAGSTKGAYFSESAEGSPKGLLDVTGTWTLVVDPGDLAGSQTFTLGEVQDLKGSTAFGATKVVHLTTKGQEAHYTFTWDGNGVMGVNYKNSTIIGGNLIVTGPDGSEADGGGAIEAGSGTADFYGTGQSGTWTLTVDPQSALTGSVTVTPVAPAASDLRTKAGSTSRSGGTRQR